mmetsp:Transcript_41931/g.64189  ORF Transcript_41931/g.64189 Transcript_41931/m.64189 type:complete len:115 (-) Transcript_41931:730-1074(-)
MSGTLPLMQGTRDSQYASEDHKYFIFEVMRCSEETKVPGDPDCATPDAIDAWLDQKFLTFKVINKKIDFNSFEEVATRQNEAFVPNVPLASGTFCDTGHRFRRNKFQRTDSWLT